MHSYGILCKMWKIANDFNRLKLFVSVEWKQVELLTTEGKIEI